MAARKSIATDAGMLPDAELTMGTWLVPEGRPADPTRVGLEGLLPEGAATPFEPALLGPLEPLEPGFLGLPASEPAPVLPEPGALGLPGLEPLAPLLPEPGLPLEPLGPSLPEPLGPLEPLEPVGPLFLGLSEPEPGFLELPGLEPLAPLPLEPGPEV